VKNWIKNWLGINALALNLKATEVVFRKELDAVTTQVDELEATDLSDVESRLDDVEEKQNDIDPDDFVRSNDLDDQIDSWMSNSDFANEDKVREIFEEVSGDLSDNIDERITETVEEQVKELSKPSNEELKELIKVVLEEMVKKLAEAK
jgi:translation elongation factor EF-G